MSPRRPTVAFFSLLFLLAACATPSLELQPRYGLLEVSGKGGFSSGGVGGAADLEEAGLEEEEVPSARLDLDFGSPHVIALGQAPQFEGRGTLDVTIGDRTNTIAAGREVDSDLDLTTIDAALVFDFFPGDTVELGLGFGVAYIDLSFSFVDTQTGTTISSDQEAPLPLAAAVASVWIGPLELGAFVGGIAYEYDDDSIYYVDADAHARLRIFGGEKHLRGSLLIGYRLTDIDLEYDDSSSDVDVDMSIQGPYAGIALSL